MPTGRQACFCNNKVATELSTPPDIATKTFLFLLLFLNKAKKKLNTISPRRWNKQYHQNRAEKGHIFVEINHLHHLHIRFGYRPKIVHFKCHKDQKYCQEQQGKLNIDPQKYPQSAQ